MDSENGDELNTAHSLTENEKRTSSDLSGDDNGGSRAMWTEKCKKLRHEATDVAIDDHLSNNKSYAANVDANHWSKFNQTSSSIASTNHITAIETGSFGNAILSSSEPLLKTVPSSVEAGNFEINSPGTSCNQEKDIELNNMLLEEVNSLIMGVDHLEQSKRADDQAEEPMDIVQPRPTATAEEPVAVDHYDDTSAGSIGSANSSDFGSSSFLNPSGVTTSSEQEVDADGGDADADAEAEADGGITDTDSNSQDTWEFPPHNWHCFRECYQREYGLRACQSPYVYCYRAMGSLYYVQRLELMCKMQNHDGCVNCLHFNSSGSRLASGSDDFNVNIWDWTRNKPLVTFESGHRANVFQVKFMPLSGDCHVVTCGRDGQVRLAELSYSGVCKSTRKLAQHRGAAHKLTLDPSSPHLFMSCGEDSVVYQIDLRDPKPNKLLICREFGELPKKVPLYSIHANPRNPFEFVVGGRDQYCRFYDKRLIHNHAAAVKKFCPHSLVDTPNAANVTCLVYNFDGSELLASYNDDDIYLFDTSHSDSADSIKCYRGHRNSATIKGVNFYGPRSEFVVSGSDCGYIYFWEKKSEKIVQFLPGDESGVVNVLEPHPTIPVLATSGLDHDVKVWVPSCEEPKFNVKLLKKLIKRNREDRANESESIADGFDARTLFLIMSRMRRSVRRLYEINGDRDEVSSSHDDNSDDDSDTDSTMDGPVTVNCRPS